MFSTFERQKCHFFGKIIFQMQELIYSAQAIQRDFRLRSLDGALVEVQKLGASGQVLLSPGWNLPHTLDHCARSIEYAMQGFPAQKNAVFQTVVGKSAFHVFDALGYMRHNLAEEILGDQYPEPEPTLEAAIARLENSIHVFQHYTGPLMPHFTYGSLTKAQYDRANAMHIANHLAAMEY